MICSGEETYLSVDSSPVETLKTDSDTLKFSPISPCSLLLPLLTTEDVRSKLYGSPALSGKRLC